MNGTGELGGERERAELALVLASPLFNRAPALSRILTFICEKRFRGEAESIKEYSIAIEALGRSQNFDSNSDTIVRVEASRLRRRLRQYYETEGAGTSDPDLAARKRIHPAVRVHAGEER